MRSNFTRIFTVALFLIGFLATGLVAQEKATCKVAVAALSLPNGSDGLLHWRSADVVTQPVQLSTRYFSEPIEMTGGVIQFFDEAVGEIPNTEPPKPVFTLKIPSGAALVYTALWMGRDEEGEPIWQGLSVDAKEWKEDSLRVVNTCSEPLGILAGEKKIRLLRGKSVTFEQRDWNGSFPVKIYRQSNVERPVFSSAWRVGKGRRELCFLFDRGKKFSVRSLIDIPAPVKEEP